MHRFRARSAGSAPSSRRAARRPPGGAPSGAHAEVTASPCASSAGTSGGSYAPPRTRRPCAAPGGHGTRRSPSALAGTGCPPRRPRGRRRRRAHRAARSGRRTGGDLAGGAPDLHGCRGRSGSPSRRRRRCAAVQADRHGARPGDLRRDAPRRARADRVRHESRVRLELVDEHVDTCPGRRARWP